MMTALQGQYVLPAAGGDLLRDGPGVLPTGVPLAGHRCAVMYFAVLRCTLCCVQYIA